MNDTLRILSGLALALQQLQEKRDPRWRQAEEKQKRLLAEFQQIHGRNHLLLLQINDLLDMQTLLAEYHAEFQFALGLQMGLELGGLDLLQDTRGREIRFRSDP